MTHHEAVRFAEHWVAARNNRDIDAILAHYSDDLEMTTPMIQRVLGVRSEPLGDIPVLKILAANESLIEGSMDHGDVLYDYIAKAKK